MSVHNASVTGNDLSTSVLLSCPWWALCFDPPTPNSHQLHVSPSFSTASLYFSHHFYQSCTNSTYCLPLTRPPLPLAAGYSPSLPPSLLLSLFALALVSQPGSRQHNVRLLCFCPQLKAVSFCCTISLLYWPSSRLCLSAAFLFTVSPLTSEKKNHFLRNPLSSGLRGDYQSVFRSSTLIAFSQTDTHRQTNKRLSCLIIC